MNYKQRFEEIYKEKFSSIIDKINKNTKEINEKKKKMNLLLLFLSIICV